MRKLILIIVLGLIFFQTSAYIHAAPLGMRLRSGQILRRSGVIILASYKFANKGGNFTGLGLAVSHQILARKLFQNGAYAKAVFHSLRARVLAVDLIKLNKKEIMLNEAMFNQEEEIFSKQSPPADELDQTLKTKGNRILDDDEAAKLIAELGKSSLD